MFNTLKNGTGKYMQASPSVNWLKHTLLILALIYPNILKSTEIKDNLFVRSFYTIDLSYANEDIALVSNSESPRLLEENKASLKNSILGSQINYNLSDNLSFVVQGQLNFDSTDKVDTDLNWVYANYDLGNDANIRIGKFQTPFLKGTELRSIGFSRLWLRPLIPGNGSSGFNEYDGVDYLKKVITKNGIWDFQVGVGKPKHGLSFIDSKNIVVAATTYQSDSYWVRTSFLRSNYEISSLDNQLLSNNALAILASIESEFHLANWQVNIGASTGNTDYSPNDKMYYLSFAYPFENITPYIYGTKRQQKFESFGRSATNPIRPLDPNRPPPLLPPAKEPVGNFSETEFALGLRWNFSTNHVAKFQISTVDIDNEAGTRTLTDTESASIFSLAIEGVF